MKIKTFVLIILFFIGIQLQAQVWESLGPDGGWAQRIEFDPSNPSKIYVGGDLFHGIMSSNDLGATWDQLDSYGTVDAWTFTLDQNIPGLMYASSMMSPATYNPLLLRSANSGVSWDTIFSGVHVTDLAIDPTDSDIIYFAAGQWQGNPGSGFGSGVWKSIDGGVSFMQVGLDTLNVQSIFVHPGFTNAIFAAAYDVSGTRPTGVYASTDSGANWFSVGLTGLQAWKLAVGKGTNAPIYAACFDGLYRTTDLGANWDKMSLPVNLPWDVEIDPNNNDVVFVVGLGEDPTKPGGVFKTVDGGTNWVKLSSGLESDRIWSVSIHPQDSDTLFVTTQGDGIWKSLDGGLNWSTAHGGYSSHYLNDLQVDGAGGVYVGFYNEHGNRFSSLMNWNETTNWTTSGYSQDNLIQAIAINSNDITEILVSDVTQNFLSPAGGEVFYSNDQSSSFSATIGKSSTYFFEEMVYDRANNGKVLAGSSLDLAFTQGNGLYQSTDGGQNWVQTHFAGISVNNVLQDHHNSNNFYSTPYLKGFWKSADGGFTWDSLGFGGWPLILDLEQDKTQPNIFYAATFENGVKKSVDGGVTWTDAGFDNMSPTSIISDPVNENTVYVAGSGLRLPGIGVWKSNNNGNTWEKISDDLVTQLIDKIEIDTVTGYLYAISQGNGVFRTQIFTPIVGLEDSEIENSYFYATNPVDNQLVISCEKGAFKYTIYNSLGRIIEEDSETNNSKKVITKDWSQGPYFIKMIHGDLTQTLKVVKR